MDMVTSSSCHSDESARRHANLPDMLSSFRNIASILLNMKTCPDTPHALATSICDLPQELCDMIYEEALLASTQTLHWVAREVLQWSNDDILKSPLTKLESLKLAGLAHWSNEMLEGRESNAVRCRLVRIFSIYTRPSTVLLQSLCNSFARCSLFEAVAVLRIFMMARECAKLRNSALCRQVLPTFSDLRFEPTSALDNSLCIRDMPSFLTAACLNDSPHMFGGSAEESWYFRVESFTTEIIVVREKGSQFVWLSLAGGGWLLTNASIKTRHFYPHGRGGCAEVDIGNAAPLLVDFAEDTTFHKYLCMFDHQAVIRAVMAHIHHCHSLKERELKAEFDRLQKIRVGNLYQEQTVLLAPGEARRLWR